MSTQAKLEQARSDAQSIRGNIEALEAKLADEQKPKLRHGDYGTCYDTPKLFQDKDGVIIATAEDGHETCNNANTNPEQYKRIGNIFDDLKAMQEDVTDGEWHDFVTDTSGNCVSLRAQMKLDSNAVWLYSTDGRGVQLKAEKLAELILYLKKAEATLKLKAAK